MKITSSRRHRLSVSLLNRTRMLGFWVGDGCYDSHSVVLSGGLDTAVIIADMVEPIAAMFDFNYSEKENGDIWLDRAVLKYAMQSIGFVGDAYTKEIPDWVWETQDELVAAFLRGYFSADGGAERDIDLYSVNESLIDGVQSLLLRFGIVARKYREGNGYSLVIGPTVHKRKFREKIGFCIDRKQEQLQWDVRHIRPDIDGVPWSDEFLVAIENGRQPNHENGGVIQTIDKETRNYFLSKGKDERCGMVAREPAASLAEQTSNSVVERLATNEVYFTQIRKVDEAHASEKGYRIEVGGSGDFMLANGIIV